MTDVIAVEKPVVNFISVVPQGPPGPPGPAAVGGAIQFNFNYGDATPALISNVLAGTTVISVSVAITNPFNGVDAALSIAGLIDSSYIDVTTIGTYESHPNVTYGIDTPLQLNIVPGIGATSGSGFLLIYVKG